MQGMIQFIIKLFSKRLKKKTIIFHTKLYEK